MSSSAACSPAEPTAVPGRLSFSGDTVLCVGGSCPGEANPCRNGGKVAKRMTEGMEVCVGASDCPWCVPRRLEWICFPWDGEKKKTTGVSPEEGHKDDPRAGAPLL